MSDIQDFIQSILPIERLQDDGVPTASVAVLEDGKISSFVITNGQENSDTVYQAASISKAICSLGVAKLIDDGKLSYDTKVVNHLDQALIDCIVDERTENLIQHVTIGHLVSHTSGLSQHGFPGYAGAAASPQDIVAGRLPANTPRLRFLSFPGSQFSYSGGGFVVLQLMLESIMGLPFRQIMQDTVLAPLGMSRSWYGDMSAEETNFTKAYFSGYSVADTGRGYYLLPELAAAGLWTTPSDLLKAVSAIQESLYTTQGFLKRGTAEILLAPVSSKGPLGPMAHGWVVDDIGFGHGGDNFPGYQCYFAGFRGDGSDRDQPRNGIAVMTNSLLGTNCLKHIVAAIMYHKEWKSGKDAWLPCARNNFVPYAAPGDVAVGQRWKHWMGKWEQEWQIVDDDGPALVFADFPPMRLKIAAMPTGGTEETLWFVVDGLSIGVMLTKDDQGSAIVVLRQEEEVTLKRA